LGAGFESTMDENGLDPFSGKVCEKIGSGIGKIAPQAASPKAGGMSAT